MSTRNLTSLLRPQSIALIGASDRPGRMGEKTWRNLTGSGFDDTLYGDNGPNVLEGGPGRDMLVGRGGKDTLVQ